MYLLVCSVISVFHKVKIKREIDAVCQLDKQIHCIAVAAVFQYGTYNDAAKNTLFINFSFTNENLTVNLNCSGFKTQYDNVTGTYTTREDKPNH